MKIGKAGKWMLRIAAAAIAAGLAWTGWVQWNIHRVEKQAVRPGADVAIVLGAALWNDRPSPALRERLDHAIQLYNDGVAGKLIVSGGLGNGTITEAEGMQHYLIEQGIPQQDIVLEKQSTSTYENILYSKKLMELNDWHSAVAVTHGYHGARALDMMRHMDYENPAVSTTDSEVLYMPWHKARETLAYTKWTLDKWTGR